MTIKAQIESAKSQYHSLTDRIYKSLHENGPGWNRQFEELATHPIKHARTVYHDMKDNPKTKSDLASLLAVLPITTPIYARSETTVGDLTTLVSLKSRATNTIISYFMISLGMEGREREHRKYGINNTTPKLKKVLVDTGYVIKVLLPVKMVSYVIAGETNIKKIVLNSLITTGIGCVAAHPLLSVIDGFKDLTGVDDTGTLPRFLKRASKRSKKNIVLAYMATGLAATAIVYAIAPK